MASSSVAVNAHSSAVSPHHSTQEREGRDGGCDHHGGATTQCRQCKLATPHTPTQGRDACADSVGRTRNDCGDCDRTQWLPDELMAEILLKAPIETLASGGTCAKVCRRWCRLLEESPSVRCAAPVLASDLNPSRTDTSMSAISGHRALRAWAHQISGLCSNVPRRKNSRTCACQARRHWPASRDPTPRSPRHMLHVIN